MSKRYNYGCTLYSFGKFVLAADKGISIIQDQLSPLNHHTVINYYNILFLTIASCHFFEKSKYLKPLNTSCKNHFEMILLNLPPDEMRQQKLKYPLQCEDWITLKMWSCGKAHLWNFEFFLLLDFFFASSWIKIYWYWTSSHFFIWLP